MYAYIYICPYMANQKVLSYSNLVQFSFYTKGFTILFIKGNIPL